VPDESTIIQAERRTNSNPNGNCFPSGSGGGSEMKKKDLTGIVEKLLWKQHHEKSQRVQDFYDQIQATRRPKKVQKASKRMTSSSWNKPQEQTTTLELNHVNDSEVAVYQSLHTENDSSNMKDEVREDF
jgi:hypothetical protein